MFEGLSRKLSLSQLINLSLATFLLLGIAATTYSVTNFTTFQSEAKGKPGGGSTATITLDQADPHLGDTVTFTTSGGKMIELTCYGSSLFDVIYTAYQAPGTAFLLGGTNSIWLSRGGSAYCSALLYNRLSSGPLASTYFNAGGAR